MEGEIPFEFTLTEGRTGTGTITIGNPGGHTDLEIEIGEVNVSGPSAEWCRDRRRTSTKVTLATDAKRNTERTPGTSVSRRPEGRAVPPSIMAPGDVLASWSPDMFPPWGVGYDGGVWISRS